jgi:putative ATPase
VADLFSAQREQKLAEAEPLAYRLRPTTLDEFVGQEHFIGPGKLLRRMLEADRLTSVIFYGPPGTGKTSLARVIANTTSAQFEQLNASAAGVKEVREILEQAKTRLAHDGRRTVLFIDELHRFNRAQQDVLLGDVERGVVILIGATTENPFFAVNSPLVSRSQIFRFEPLTDEHLFKLLRRALTDKDRGFGRYTIEVDEDALMYLAKMADGDARRALSGLEVAVLSQMKRAEAGQPMPGSDFETSRAAGSSTRTGPGGSLEVGRINIDVAKESIQRKALVYDRTGDEHYDHASAFIKSMRGSDPDAAVYWLARMLESGEDIRFIARRIAICAAEDVGNADPMALMLANPNLLEHERFTDLLWAVSHLLEELTARTSLEDLPPSDVAHLAGDVRRVYSQLTLQWLLYCRHLQASYPYIFSIMARTHPLQDSPSAVVR